MIYDLFFSIMKALVSRLFLSFACCVVYETKIGLNYQV